MRKISLFLVLVIVASGGLLLALGVRAEGQNLIANSSMESAASATQPQGWTTNAWGNNTSNFSYQNGGHTGSKSVRAEITNFTDGDAKWYFDPVAVTANETYTYSDFYQSNVETQIIVRYTHTSGGFSYEWIGSAAPNANWSQASFNFDVPSNTTHVTVFHIVASVGWLTLDDASLTVADTPPSPEPGGNLVANASTEISTNDTAPDAWASNAWGQNAATFSYLDSGHTGGKSVRAEVTSYSDGDAKWYFDAVDVAPSTDYVFRDYYQSNTSTQAVVRYTHNDDSFSYELLGQIPASAPWSQSEFSFTTPSTAKAATVFHIVANVGWLVLDDAFVGVAEPAVVQPPNASVETPGTNPAKPAQWQSNAWGNNSSSFEYSTSGHTGGRSVKVAMSNYVNGDAKWYYEPQVLTPGKTYRVAIWYRGTALPQPTVMYTKGDGTSGYLAIPSPDPVGDANTWKLFSDTFTVPSDAHDVSVFLKIAQNGWLQTDDYAIEAYEPVGFDRPLVTMTFDDGHEENVSTALPVLSEYNLPSTHCFATSFIEGVVGGPQNVLAFRDAGHEICSHSVTHPFMTQLSPTDLDYEAVHSQQYLEGLVGADVKNFATPYGDYNPAVIAKLQQLYRSHRTVDQGYNSKDNFNIYKVRVQNMLDDTSLAEFESWLDHAEATNTWLVLVYHRITASTPGPYDTRLSDFEQQAQAVSASGLTVKTYDAALDEVVPQLP